MLKYTFITLFLLAWLLVPVYLPFTRLSVVSVVGAEENQALMERISEAAKSTITPSNSLFPSNSYFIFNPSHTQNELSEKFSELSQITVEKKFPNSLVISIHQKTELFSYLSGKNILLLDQEGSLVRTETLEDSPSLTALSALFENLPSTSTTVSTTPSTEIENVLRKNKDYVRMLRVKFKHPVLLDYRLDRYATSTASTTSSTSSAAIVPKNVLGRFSEWFDAAPRHFGELLGCALDNGAFPNRFICLFEREPWLVLTTSDMAVEDAVQLINKVRTASSPQEYIDIRLPGRIYWK